MTTSTQVIYTSKQVYSQERSNCPVKTSKWRREWETNISCERVQSGIGRRRIDKVLKPVQRKEIHKVGILGWFSL